MADTQDEASQPFDFTSRAANAMSDLSNQWSTWLDNPQNRTFLLQTGAALLQPPAFGQTPAGHFGQAVTAGAEAVSRQAQQESKQQLEAARAEAAGATAGQQVQRLTIAQLQRESIEKGKMADNIRDAQKAHLADEAYLEKVYTARIKAWEDPLGNNKKGPKPTEPPKLSFEEWLKSSRGAQWASTPGVAAFLAGGRKPAPEQPKPDTENGGGGG